MTAIFRDRIDAGTALAAQLLAYKNRPDVLVLALPRGGVPVAFVVAEALRAPLDVLLVRKLGVPGHEELAMESCAALQKSTDAVVCVKTPQPFYGVGQWHDDFSQTTDQEVRQLLSLAAAPYGTTTPRSPAGNRSEGDLPIPILSSETRELPPTVRGPRG